jgi:hypothetical protein
MKHLGIILSFFLTTSCYCQDELSLVSNWRHFAIPLNQDSLERYGFDLLGEWRVFIKDNEVVATKNRYFALDSLPFKIIPSEGEQNKIGGRQSFLKVDDGYLVGFYRGEWGGNLFWFSEDGSTKYEISNHEIVNFIKRNGKIYAIEGLAHLRSSRGSIIEIRKINNQWTASEYIKLPSAPDGVDIDNENNLIIITSESLLAVTPDSKIKFLIEEGIWNSGLYPTSLIIKNNVAFMGMRKGVFKYNLTTKKQEWLMPK